MANEPEQNDQDDGYADALEMARLPRCLDLECARHAANMLLEQQPLHMGMISDLPSGGLSPEDVFPPSFEDNDDDDEDGPPGFRGTY